MFGRVSLAKWVGMVGFCMVRIYFFGGGLCRNVDYILYMTHDNKKLIQNNMSWAWFLFDARL